MKHLPLVSCATLLTAATCVTIPALLRSQLPFINSGMPVADLCNLGHRKFKTYSASLFQYSEFSETLGKP